jgi:hypothetical protein
VNLMLQTVLQRKHPQLGNVINYNIEEAIQFCKVSDSDNLCTHTY